MEKQDAKELERLRKRLKRTVKTRGSQKAVAKAADIDAAEVCRILKGKNPRYTTAMRLLSLDNQ